MTDAPWTSLGLIQLAKGKVTFFKELWECDICGNLILVEVDQVIAPLCVPCDRWARRWEA